MSESTPLAAIPPEDKDWTYVITDGCTECGYQPHEVTQTAARVRATVPLWQAALAGAGARERPAPTTWSPLEYGCHVRDTQVLFRERLLLMLGEDDPLFANWDQDAAAVEGRYAEQDPTVVSVEYAAAVGANAAVWDEVGAGDWGRPGRRSNGSVFTVETFARYFLHDIEHHLHDVGHPVAEA